MQTRSQDGWEEEEMRSVYWCPKKEDVRLESLCHSAGTSIRPKMAIQNCTGFCKAHPKDHLKDWPKDRFKG